MLILTAFMIASITIIIVKCSSSSKPNVELVKPAPEAPKTAPKAEAMKIQKAHQEHKKVEEVSAIRKTVVAPSVLTVMPLKDSPEKNKANHKKSDPVVAKNPSVMMNKSKEVPKKKAPTKNSKDSSYAGIHDASEVKTPTQKLPSVMTIPSKEPLTANPAPPPLPLESPKPPKTGEINEKSDDTIENIPSVRTKEGASFEGDSSAIISPAGTKEDGKLVPFKPMEGEKK